MYFSFNFVWDSTQLGLVREEQGNEGEGGGRGGWGLRNRQNLLSVKKVIC